MIRNWVIHVAQCVAAFSQFADMVMFGTSIHCKKLLAMKQDGGKYTMSAMYDQFLAISHHYHWKNHKKNC